MNTVLKLDNVSFSYTTKAGPVEILQDATYEFASHTIYTIFGSSGSGKTTTLSLLGALDAPAKGRVLFEGRDIRETGEGRYRNRNVGIIFQSYNLLNYLTPLQNVLAAMDIARVSAADKKERARELLKKMGLSEELFNRNVNRLSGGEQQRVAIARAISTNAEILLADEPTGNLDADTAKEIMDIFIRLAHEEGKCVIVVTHSQEFAQVADVVVRLEGKRLVNR
ncbi:MAG: ABC transporter ATP-binding protein [Eubacteriales bacterium]|nr:ABC transporter ATP-binding protein [Eubacteriales bacterium]